MSDETFQRVSVDIPRTQLIILRRTFPGNDLVKCVEKCVESFTGGWRKGVELSKDCINEVSSLLNVETFNSESTLIEAIKKRFNLGPRSVVIDLDESLEVKIRAKARGNDQNFSDYVRRFVHSMFRYGVMDWDMHTVFFDDKQYKRMKKAMVGTACTAENISRIIAEWQSYKTREVTAPAETTKASSSEKVLVVADVNLSGDGKPAIKGLRVEPAQAKELSKAVKAVPPQRGTQEERDKLKEAMDKMVAAGSAKPKEPPAPPAEEPTNQQAAGDNSSEQVYEVPTF